MKKQGNFDQPCDDFTPQAFRRDVCRKCFFCKTDHWNQAALKQGSTWRSRMSTTSPHEKRARRISLGFNRSSSRLMTKMPTVKTRFTLKEEEIEPTASEPLVYQSNSPPQDSISISPISISPSTYSDDGSESYENMIDKKRSELHSIELEKYSFSCSDESSDDVEIPQPSNGEITYRVRSLSTLYNSSYDPPLTVDDLRRDGGSIEEIVFVLTSPSADISIIESFFLGYHPYTTGYELLEMISTRYHDSVEEEDFIMNSIRLK
eukprot:TRINITY_DN3660_c0_g1_i2.p2 TRINITY_DN3660_c0_g1~~TRINITY_DN3660_c0_g1_i2.p2  ORF type:complete len:263 (-),score=56.55 TRINITY_DN3660_c0_g1_i2:1091-1879(-)